MSELFEAISPQIKKGEFSVCEKRGDEYLCRYSGKLGEIADELISAGIIRHIMVKGEDVYFIVNEQDLDEFDPDYDVSG